MWLEGAVQNGWSVSQMRRSRSETLGIDIIDEATVAAEADGDQMPEDDFADESADELSMARSSGLAGGSSESDDVMDDEEGEDYDGESATSEEDDESNDVDGASIYAEGDERASVGFVRPFTQLTELPDDIADAFESFKLAILRHKAEDWQQVSREDVLASLDALKEMAMAATHDSPA